MTNAASESSDATANAGDDHFAPPPPVSAAREPAAPVPASPQDAQRALAGASRAAANAQMDQLPGPSAEQRALGRPELAGGRGRGQGAGRAGVPHAAHASVNPVDVAGMLVSDIGKDLGF